MDDHPVNPELLKILVCPADKGRLIHHKERLRLECASCGRHYPVRDGIPIMLIDEAETASGAPFKG